MSVEIKLTYDEEKKTLRVDGDILDKLVVFGILEMAKEIVSNFHATMQRKASK